MLRLGSCNKSYISETGRGIETRLKEHKRDLRNNMEHSVFVLHAQKQIIYQIGVEPGFWPLVKTEKTEKTPKQHKSLQMKRLISGSVP